LITCIDETRKTINAPREYISWSQFDSFKRDPERYIQHYIYGKEGFENEAMRLGKKLAKRIGNRRGIR